MRTNPENNKRYFLEDSTGIYTAELEPIYRKSIKSHGALKPVNILVCAFLNFNKHVRVFRFAQIPLGVKAIQVSLFS